MNTSEQCCQNRLKKAMAALNEIELRRFRIHYFSHDNPDASKEQSADFAVNH